MKNHFSKYSEIKEEMRYNNYERVMNQCSSNIVYSVKKVNENENGAVDWAGKKFETLCEKGFINLKNIEEMVLDQSQKMNLILSNNKEDSLSGKFFKRKFLNDYNIRFRHAENNESPSTVEGYYF